jgi:hypothetical protein
VVAVSDDVTRGCTCTGCPPARHKILFHYSQELAWNERGEWVPMPPDDEACCPNGITAEDLLCGHCRERGGISFTDEAAIRAYLAAHSDRYAVN